MIDVGVGGGAGRVRNLNIRYNLSWTTGRYDAEVGDPNRVRACINAELLSRTMTTCGLLCSLPSGLPPT